jgi:glycosyltransferase involved in cell wall biosynthesis
MHILICNRASVPVTTYGGTERVIWDLGRKLVEQGHQVTFLVPEGSYCPFARILPFEKAKDIASQIPNDIDIVHFQFDPGKDLDLDIPWLITHHGNSDLALQLPLNTVFVSTNQAFRHGSRSYVANGLDWRTYGKVDLDAPKDYFHFLGKAAWRVKNVKGAIDLCTRNQSKLIVMGGKRFNIKSGLRFTWSRQIKFLGMVGGETKFEVMRHSKGLVFPVRWHEPFGLAVIESLYFGSPVFATPYGALPELVPEECGHLSADSDDLLHAMNQNKYSRQACHQLAKEIFNADRMAQGYLSVYSRILDGERLNDHHPQMHEPAWPLPWN